MRRDLSNFQIYHVNGHWPEEDFLDTFGDMKVTDFITKHMYSYLAMHDNLDDFNKLWGNQTVRSYYVGMLSRCKGIKNIFLCGRDELEVIFVDRTHDTFEVTTKPDGESRCWLEVGSEKEYTGKFGDSYKKWIRHEYRYPNHDERLETKRYFAGDHILWRILVPQDYPLAIRLISRGPIIIDSYINTTERTLWAPHRGLLVDVQPELSE